MQKEDEYYFKEGCFIEEWHNTSDDEDMSIARVRVEVGKTTKPHSLLGTRERYLILEGSATVNVGDRSWGVEPKSVVEIAPNVSQSIRNDGEADLIFLAICTPRFKESNYRED